MSGLWSWGIFIVGSILGYLMSTGRSWAWIAAAVGQVVWVPYALIFDQYGFIVMAGVNAFIQVVGWRNLRGLLWRRCCGCGCADRVSAEVAA